MYRENYEAEKTVKINKKAKLKSLKQVIDICIKTGRSFEFSGDGSDLTIYTDEGNEVIFKPKHFGKEHSIKYAELDFCEDSGDLMGIVYHTKDNDFPKEFAQFFTNFPKLSKSDKQATELPPGPEVLATLPAGAGHNHHDIKHLDNDTIVVGCNSFNMEQADNIFKFLGGVLDYDVE